MADPSAELERIAILPLRNAVLFPMSVVPINVGRPRSVRLVEDLAAENAQVGVVTQLDPETVAPTFDDIHRIGTLARVVKVIRLGPGNYSVVLNGICRFAIEQTQGLEPYMQADVRRFAESTTSSDELVTLGQTLRERTREVLGLMPDLPKETAGILDNVREPGALADLIASNLPEEHASLSSRQQVLEAIDVTARVRTVLQMVNRQLEVLRVKGEISSMVQEEMGKSQREYVLRQQLKTIREELGEVTDDDELEELRERVAQADLPNEPLKAARKQLRRLANMQPQSAEFNVARNYVEWLADLPWTRTTPDRIDVSEVRKCLDEDHWGLEKVKKRIVEYVAIRQLRADKRGPILLFVGPPGVGKTSLGRSIARSMGREYGRIALGGVRDEAEVRGHRRTYVGALPGRIIQALKKVGTKNPVLVLDEVDKLGADVRGDPASALLEVLDPAQNDTFEDHYLGLPFDLSQVTFLATANYYQNIPDALKDRLETIEVPGYARIDKLNIAEQFLVPKQLLEHGLTEKHLRFSRLGLETIVDSYTREAGVRGLEREIAAVCREVAVRLAEGKAVENEEVDREHVERVLGVTKFRPELAERNLHPGVATGLSLTSTGGDILVVEASRMPGKGRIRVTGSLRNIMQESAHTAVSFVRSKTDALHLKRDFMKDVDLHLHVPRGGVARDGASAGLTMFVAVASLFLGVPVRASVAVIGELTLRGSVLPIHGFKDKVLAAHRAGIREIVLPERNRRDLDDVADEVAQDLRFHFVSRVDQVLPLVLENVDRPSGGDPMDDDVASRPGGVAV